MFTAYYDESGSPDAHSVVVAGFVASDDQWKEFERNWNESLHQFGISHFHAVEFAQSVGEFAKWKGHEKNPDLQGERQWFLRQLLAHIKLRSRFCCAHVVRMTDYRKVNAVYILDAVQPYALCGRTAVASVSKWASRNKIPEAQIRHIFEDGAKHKGFLLKRLIKDKGFEPIFKKKDEAVPLQAADLLAYETFVGIRSIFEKGVADFDDLGVSAFVEEFSEEMNVRPELKEAVLLQRMKFWLLRARYGPIGNCSKSRGKKNFWALVRRHRALAERYGLRETDVF